LFGVAVRGREWNKGATAGRGGAASRSCRHGAGGVSGAGVWGLLCPAGAKRRLGLVRRVARCSEQHRFTRRYIPAPRWGEEGVGWVEDIL
jgi:hypothetical protein